MKKFILLFAWTTILFACNNDANQEGNNTDDSNAVEEAEGIETSPNAFLQNSFPTLFSFYKNSDSSFNINHFEEAQTTAIDNFDVYKIDTIQMREFLPYLVYNSDSTLAIDLYSYNYVLTKRDGKINADAGGPDTEVALIDVKNNSKKRIFYSGPAINLLEAKWIDDVTVMLAGIEVGEENRNKPIVLKSNIKTNNIKWYVYSKSIETDVSNYVEENVMNKLN
jgi:hypothetical protein